MPITLTSAFPAKSKFTAVVLNDSMWILGGISASALTNDLWRSGDGANWIQVTAANQYTARRRFSSTVYNNSIIISGGNSNTQN